MPPANDPAIFAGSLHLTEQLAPEPMEPKPKRTLLAVHAHPDDETITNAQRHARENHEMALTREQAIAMARPA